MAERNEAEENQVERKASASYPLETANAIGEDMQPGYRHTEEGVIPEDWETKRLGEFVSIRNQKVMPSSVHPDTPCIELEHIGQGDGRLLSSSTAKYSTASKYRFRAGDVLFGRLRSYLRKYWLAGRDGVCTTEIWPLMVDSNRATSGFLLGIIQTDRFNESASISYGTHMPRADWKVLKNFEVSLPDVKEQTAIATALSDADALIESLDRLIAKKRALRQATMQQLLTGQTRLPGFTGKWEMKRLGEIGTFYKGQGIRRDDLSDEGVPCIRYGEIYTRYSDCVAKAESYIPKAVAETAFPLRSGDILFAGSGETAEEIGKCVAYVGEQLAFAGGDIVVLRPHQGETAYLGRLLNHPTLAKQKARLGQGDAVVHISGQNLAQIEVLLPAQEEQTAIATVLSDMDTEIEALERRRDKARQIKQGMMQQLLTGRVRLVEPEIAT